LKRKSLFVATAAHDDPTEMLGEIQPLIDSGLARWVTHNKNPMHEMWLAFQAMGQAASHVRIMSSDIVLLMITQRFMGDERCVQRSIDLFKGSVHMSSTRVIPVQLTGFKPELIGCPPELVTPLIKPIDQFDSASEGWGHVRSELMTVLSKRLVVPAAVKQVRRAEFGNRPPDEFGEAYSQRVQ